MKTLNRFTVGLFRLLLFCLCVENVAAQTNNGNVFKVIPLGVYGGSDESNLSCYMLAPQHSNSYICLDAGTLHAGIVKAIEKNRFRVI